MMAEAKVDQPSINPTQKLTAATAAAAFMAALLWILELVFPSLPNTELVAGLTPFAVFVSGYVVRDRPNVEVPRDA